MPIPVLTDFRACAWSTVSFRAAEMAAARALVESAHPGDAIVVSCQRLEAYGFGPCDCGAPDQALGRDAVVRLSAVAAGVESVVLGEDQVMGQVRAAFKAAPSELRAAADIAISAARALRSETSFESHSGHLLDKALRLSTVQRGGTLLVLGAGAMGNLIAARAAALGFNVTVAARRQPSNLEHAYVELGQVPSLPPFDVIVGCLGSGAGEISPRALPTARLLIDLGTPRNFNVPSGPGAIAISDMLRDEARRPHATARRERLRTRLGTLVDERLRSIASDSRSPAGAFRAHVEAIRQTELARYRKMHPEVPSEVLDRVTQSLLEKVLHLPTARLKDADQAAATEFLAFFAPAEPAITPGASAEA